MNIKKGRHNAGVTAFAVLFLVGSACQSAEPAAPLIVDAVYLHPSRLVEIEPGRKMNLYCTGSGSPTVIFEAGMTDPTNVWGFVQPVVAANTRACSYDRAGVGFSDPARLPSTSANIVDDLHRLLRATSIDPPYILVGASSGAIHVRLYAATYPAEVVGMVLVDPSSEYQSDSYRKIDPRHLTMPQWEAQVVDADSDLRHKCIAAADASKLVVGSDLYEKCSFPQYKQLSPEIQTATIKFQMTAAMQRAQLSEEEAFDPSQDELLAARRDLGDMLLIVLTKASPPPPTTPLSPDKEALRVARNNLWFDLNKRIAAWSTRGVQRVVPGTGHGIELERPQAVSDAILEVLHDVGPQQHS
ncbi:MAG TPA: alpha/beta hydrolase [Gammaproteobacteria bacterium]|jgi:pimeloyl-ACP methyl ester carboxylesterase